MKIVYLSKIPDLFCYSILPILHMCCFPATNSPVGSWGSLGLFLFSALFLLPRSCSTEQQFLFYFLSSFFSLAAYPPHRAPTLLSLSALSAFLQMNHFFATVFVKRKKIQSKTNEHCEMSRRLLNNSLENGTLIASLMEVLI